MLVNIFMKPVDESAFWQLQMLCSCGKAGFGGPEAVLYGRVGQARSFSAKPLFTKGGSLLVKRLEMFQGSKLPNCGQTGLSFDS